MYEKGGNKSYKEIKKKKKNVTEKWTIRVKV